MEREREILELFAQWLTCPGIGEAGNNSGLTGRNAMSRIYKKLGFRTGQQLAVWAVRFGLVDDTQP